MVNDDADGETLELPAYNRNFALLMIALEGIAPNGTLIKDRARHVDCEAVPTR